MYVFVTQRFLNSVLNWCENAGVLCQNSENLTCFTQEGWLQISSVWLQK